MILAIAVSCLPGTGADLRRFPELVEILTLNRKLADLTKPGRPQPAWAEHGEQDTRSLRRLPRDHPRKTANLSTHGVITGELRARKRARVVRTGGRWKRTCLGRHLASGLPVCRLRLAGLIQRH